MDKKIKKIKRFLKRNGFEYIENYINGEETFWAFNKKRDIELSIKINDMPNLEDIENFEEYK